MQVYGLHRPLKQTKPLSSLGFLSSLFIVCSCLRKCISLIHNCKTRPLRKYSPAVSFIWHLLPATFSHDSEGRMAYELILIALLAPLLPRPPLSSPRSPLACSRHPYWVGVQPSAAVDWLVVRLHCRATPAEQGGLITRAKLWLPEIVAVVCTPLPIKCMKSLIASNHQSNSWPSRGAQILDPA